MTNEQQDGGGGGDGNGWTTVMSQAEQAKLWAEVRRKLWHEDRMTEHEVANLINSCMYESYDITHHLDLNSR